MIISQWGGSVVAAGHLIQVIQSIYRDGVIAGLKVVVPDEATWESEQS